MSLILKEINQAITAKTGVVTILSDTTPESLEIDGGDVEGIRDDYEFAPGSVIITPDADYIAFEEGVFTQKYNTAPTEG